MEDMIKNIDWERHFQFGVAKFATTIADASEHVSKLIESNMMPASDEAMVTISIRLDTDKEKFIYDVGKIKSSKMTKFDDFEFF